MRTEDGRIIQECLNGDPSAFGMLVDKYKAGVYAFIYDKLRDFRDAQDVTQEVFEKAYRNLHSLRNWESFTFWLYRIARNLCKNWIRDQSRRPDQGFIEDQDPAILGARSLSSYRESQAHESLQEALDSLPDSYREVLLLHYFGGMSIKDMARSLSASPSAIGMRLSRARIHLREEMMATMGGAFKGQKLQSSFTFRIVEAVKRMKINPTPRMAGLPWGLSLAIGLIVTVLSINPNLNIFNPASSSVSSALPSVAKVLKAGEIPVDILKISEISAISSKQGDNSGGFELPGPRNALLLAPQAQGNTWTRKADMPTARQTLSTSVVNGKIYAIGGREGENALSTLEEYDPATNKWIEKRDMPTARLCLSSSAVHGKIYVIGGNDDLKPLSTVEEYDPVTNTWVKKANMPTTRSYLATGAVNGKIYAIGGYAGAKILSVVEEYDPVTDKWTKKRDMPTARSGFSIAVANGRIYAIGGHDNTEILPTVEEYDPVTDKWTRKADMPSERSSLAASSVGGRIYAIGGWASQVIGGQIVVRTFPVVEEYDPMTDKWTKKPDMPTARDGLSASAVGERIYAIGGSSKLGVLPTVEEYDTGFAVEPKGKLPTTWGKTKSQ